MNFETSFEERRQRLLDLLRTHAHERRTVTLSSGRVSDFYVDCKQVVLRAEGHFLVGSLMRELIERHAPTVTLVGGLTMGADPLVSAVSLTSYLVGKPLDGFYVRKEPKAHGTGEWIEGRKALRAGAGVAILEDVVTTGASAIQAILRSRNAGLEVCGVFALVDREEGGREIIERESPLHRLFSPRDFA